MRIEIEDKLIEQLIEKEDLVHKVRREDWVFFEQMLTEWINEIVRRSIKEI